MLFDKDSGNSNRIKRCRLSWRSVASFLCLIQICSGLSKSMLDSRYKLILSGTNLNPLGLLFDPAPNGPRMHEYSLFLYCPRT